MQAYAKYRATSSSRKRNSPAFRDPITEATYEPRHSFFIHNFSCIAQFNRQELDR